MDSCFSCDLPRHRANRVSLFFERATEGKPGGNKGFDSLKRNAASDRDARHNADGHADSFSHRDGDPHPISHRHRHADSHRDAN